MQLLKALGFSLMTIVLFAGTIGWDVFTHTCEEDGVSVAYVINTIEHCDEHKEELPPCCQEEEEEDDCCDDEVSYYNLKFDFFENIQLHVFQVIYVLPHHFEIIDEIQKDESIAQYTNTDPPPISVARRLSLIQSYLI